MFKLKLGDINRSGKKNGNKGSTMNIRMHVNVPEQELEHESELKPDRKLRKNSLQQIILLCA